MDVDDEDIARIVREFEREAVVTATLEHPNIVPVHDLGRDDHGRPLLAMKMVKGDPWDDHIARDFKSMDSAEYLVHHVEVLIAVCQAVAFAHSRGVIHRDLKPSQVVVGEFGEVVVLDWGLAMLFDEMLLPTPVRESPFAATLPTRENATNPCGTPAFMAPEQTVKETGALGPWTDVFLLGATLYFILTGATPYGGPTAMAVFREACQCRPRPPRERAPGREMPEELVQLCMRAMRHDPKERPASVREFMADLEAWLSGSARRRESADLAADVGKRLEHGLRDYEDLEQAAAELRRAEQLWPANPAVSPLTERVLTAFAREALANGDLGLARWQADQIATPEAKARIGDEIADAERRRRAQVRQRRTALGVAAALLVALVGFAFAYSAQQRRANALLAEQMERTDSAREDAEDTINFIVRDLRARLEPVGQLPVLEEMAEKAVAYYANQPADATSPDVLHRRVAALRQLGDARQRRGRLEEAIAAYDQALDLARLSSDRAGWEAERAEIMTSMGEVRLVQGRLDDAEKLHADALALFGELKVAEPRESLWARRAAATEQAIARVLEARGLLDDALAMHRRALGEIKDLVDARPNDREARRELGGAHNAVGRVLQNKGVLDEALVEFRAGLALLDALVAEDASNRPWQQELSQSLRTVGGALELRGMTNDAAAQFERSLAINETLATFDPSNIDLQDGLSTALNSLARIRRQQGRLAETLELFTRSMEIRERLLSQDPTNARWRRDLSISHRAVGGTREWLGQSDGAIASYREALEIIRGVVEIDANNWRWQLDMGITHGHLGRMLRTRGDLDESAAEFRRALEVYQGILAKAPDNAQVMRERAWARGELGATLARLGMRGEARTELGAALEEVRLLREKAPENAGHRRDDAVMRLHVGRLLRDEGRMDEARREFDTALADLRAVSQADPANALRRSEVADCLYEIAVLAREERRPDDAATAAQECDAVRAALAEEDADNAFWHLAVGRVRVLRARLAMGTGDLAAAHALLDQARAEDDRLPAEARDDEPFLEAAGELALADIALARREERDFRTIAREAADAIEPAATARRSDPLRRIADDLRDAMGE